MATIQRQKEILNNIINVIQKSNKITGLCDTLTLLKHLKLISDEEYLLIQKLFLYCHPLHNKQYKQFVESDLWICAFQDDVQFCYWWQPIENDIHNQQARQVRIDFLNEVIKNL